MKLDILAIAVHPDDIELGCGGTLIKHVKKGQKVGVIDLTQGEMGTRGTIETRYQEATKAAKVMGLAIRGNLKMQDAFFVNDYKHQFQVIQTIRHFQPQIVITNALDDRHPDHGRAGKLVADACFLSGLRKVETEYEGQAQEHWRPKGVFHIIQDTFRKPDVIVDISDVQAEKMKAVQCYGTQFSAGGSDDPMTHISQSNFLERIKARDLDMGFKIGTAYGEGFNCRRIPGVSDLNQLIYPEFP